MLNYRVNNYMNPAVRVNEWMGYVRVLFAGKEKA